MDKIEYMLKKGFSHYEGGKRIRAGTTVKMTSKRFRNAHLSDRFAPVDSKAKHSDILAGTVEEVLDALQAEDYDVEKVADILDEEKQGSNRITLTTQLQIFVDDPDKLEEFYVEH